MIRSLLFTLTILLNLTSVRAQLFMVKDLVDGVESSFPSRYFIFKDQLYFITNNNGMWRTDGKRAGTEKFLQLGVNYSYITTGKNLFYFTNYDETNGIELWRSDGTVDGTFLLKDIRKGANIANDPRRVIVINDTAYFIAYDDEKSYQVYMSDGTSAGTKRISDIEYDNLAYGPMNLYQVGNRLILVSVNKLTPVTSGIYFYNTNTQSFDLFTTYENASNSFNIPSQFTEFNNKMYFVAEKDSSFQIWQSDYTLAGTKILKKINSPAFSGSISIQTVFDNHLFFVAYTLQYGYEIWKTDGTEAGTQIMCDIIPGASSSSPGYLNAHKGKLYFVFFGSSSFELAYFNNAQDTIPVKLYYKNGSGAVNFSNLIYTKNNIYFFAVNQFNKGGLYKSDGNTIEFVDSVFSKNSFMGVPLEMFEFKDELYFSAFKNEFGEELWRTRFMAPDKHNFSFTHFLYPNPATNVLRILPRAIEYINSNFSVNIVDQTGKTVLLFNNLTSYQTELDIASLSSGLYTVILSSDNSIVLKEIIMIQ